MADAPTFFAQISSFFSTFFAYVFRTLFLKHRSTTIYDDLEAGIPSVERRISDHSNTALPVVSGSVVSGSVVSGSVVSDSRSVDGFVDVGLDSDSKIKETKTVPIVAHDVPAKTSVVDADQSHHFQPTGKFDRSVPFLFPAIPVIPQNNVIDNRSKHRAFHFGPYSLDDDFRKPRSLRRQDSFSDLLDLFPAPPKYIPPTISEEESTVRSSPEPISVSSTDPSISISISISISNETANTSVHEILELPCTSAIFKVLSSGIDIKNKNISRLTLIHNPEILVSPATDVGDPSAHSPHAPHARPRSFCAFTDIQPLENASAPLHNLEDSSHRPVDEHTSVQAPVEVVPAAPTRRVGPYVAPLRIVKKNMIQPPVAPLEPIVARRPLSGNWEQAMDDVLQAFRDAESEDGDFRDLFTGNESFVTQSSDVHGFRNDRGDLDNHDDDEGDCEGRLEESFYSIDENLSMAIASSGLVAPKIEVPSSVSLSSEGVVSQQVMEVKDEANNVNVPELRLCDCEGCGDSSYSWTAVTDGDDDNHSHEEVVQWSERLELNEYAS